MSFFKNTDKNLVPVSSRTYAQLQELIGRKVHFISDCELFPNFKVWVTVMDVHLGNDGEIVFETKRTNGKSLTIGSRMKNLRYSL